MVWDCFPGSVWGADFIICPKTPPLMVSAIRKSRRNNRKLYHALSAGWCALPCLQVHKGIPGAAELPVIDCLSNSPDLNRLENLWNRMKNLLKKKDILSIAELTNAIKELMID
jgi:hypothetical protein